jgi:pimeloyl-ACP methyl ester carboxylesterase
VTCPVLVLQGEADEYGTPAQVAAIAGAVAGPAETALLPGIGHSPHHQAGEAVLALVADFLERLELGGQSLDATQMTLA